MLHKGSIVGDFDFFPIATLMCTGEQFTLKGLRGADQPEPLAVHGF